MSAFGFVPGIAFFPVIARPRIAHALQPLRHHAPVHHQHGGGVFKARHGLSEIGKRNVRALALAIVADDQRCFIVEREGALHVVVLFKAALVVVTIDRPERGADVDR